MDQWQDSVSANDRWELSATFRSQVRLAETDLLALSRMIPDLQIVGSGKAALVTYVLGRVSLTEVLGHGCWTWISGSI